MALVIGNGWVWALGVLMVVLPSWAEAGDEVELPEGLVLHFDFDGVEEGRVPNLEGAAEDGVAKDARFVRIGESGMAMAVRQNEEQRNYVEVADHAGFNGQAFTVAAWVCPRRIDISGAVFCKHDWLDGGSRGFTLRANGIHTMNFTVGAGGWMSVNTETPLVANTWIHVTAAFDGRNLFVYANGEMEDTLEITEEYIPSPYPLRIGHGAFKLDKHRKFDGKIDEVMIWDRALTQNEIRNVYEATKGNLPAPLTEEDVAELVMRLAAEGFRERVEAQLALAELGPSVVPQLEEELGSATGEIRMRLEKVIRELSDALPVVP